MIDISPADEMIVNAILKKHVAKCEVRAFGSRHKWTAKSYSDLDLAIVGAAKLDKSVIYALQEAFEESELSFRVDVLDWYAISDEFRQIIEQGYSVIQEKPLLKFKEYELQELISKFIDYRGKTPQKTTYGIPLITAKIVKNGQIQEPTEFIAAEDYDKWMTRGFPEINDVVLTTEAPLGEVALINDTKVALAQRIITLQTNKDLCNNVYLKYLLQSPYGQSILQSRSSGSTVQGIKSSELKKLKFSIPPIEEQKEIAIILSSLDDKIELNRQINQTLEEIAQALFNYYFMNSDYKTHPLSELIDFNPSYKVPNPNSVAYLEMANINTNSYRATNWCYRKSGSGAKFKNGDTLFARITPCLENGKTCFVDFLADNEIAYGSTEYIVMRSKEQFHPFLSYLIAKNQNFRNYAINTMIGTSGRQRAQADKLAHFEIHLPSSELITSINSQLESITSKLKNTSEQIEALINIRDALLPKLISGEVNISVGKHL